jgi:hypothetical protein
MVDLILRPSSLSANPRVRWALQLRYHESCGETEYVTLCRVGDSSAQESLRAGEYRLEPALQAVAGVCHARASNCHA